MNKQLRSELVIALGRRRSLAAQANARVRNESHERDEEQTEPDVLDQMSGMGRIRLDD